MEVTRAGRRLQMAMPRPVTLEAGGTAQVTAVATLAAASAAVRAAAGRRQAAR